MSGEESGVQKANEGRKEEEGEEKGETGANILSVGDPNSHTSQKC